MSVSELKAKLLQGGLTPEHRTKPLLTRPKPVSPEAEEAASGSAPTAAPDERDPIGRLVASERREREQAVRKLQQEVDALRAELQAERVQRQKITAWIKDNLGPNLEVVLGRVSEMMQQQPQPQANMTTPPTSRPAVVPAAVAASPGPAAAAGMLPSAGSAATVVDIFGDSNHRAADTSGSGRPNGLQQSQQQQQQQQQQQHAGSLRASASGNSSSRLLLDLGLDVFDAPSLTPSAVPKADTSATAPSSRQPQQQQHPHAPAAGAATAKGASATQPQQHKPQRSALVEDEEVFWSDQSWSSDDDDDSLLPPASGTTAKATPRKQRLGQLEQQQRSNSGLDGPLRGWFDQKRDATVVPTMSKVNIAPSTHLHATAYNCPTDDLLVLLKAMSQRNAKVLFVPPEKRATLALSSEPESERDRRPDFVLGVLKNDQLYPSCPDGLSRSQILFLVLQGVKRMLGVANGGVHLPHGALFGYDTGSADDDKRALLQFTYKDEARKAWLAKPFQTAFGVKKCDRFGEKEGKTFHSHCLDPNKNKIEWKTNFMARQKMANLFDLFYYRQPPKRQGRAVYFAFQQALPVVLDRLLTTNDGPLDDVIVVALPFDDDADVPDNSPERRALGLSREQMSCRKHLAFYKQLATLIKAAES